MPRSRLSRVLIAAIAILLCVLIARRWYDHAGVPPMPEPAVSGFAPVNGIRMYYASYGAGPPILMIHGGLASADIWANQIAPLVAAGHRVIVADSRGQGRSTRGDTPLGYGLMTSDYLALLDYLNVRKVALVGWSDGGIIGLDIAMHHPERLTRLFAQGANATVDGVISNQDSGQGMAFITWMTDAYRRHFSSADDRNAVARQMADLWAREPNWTADELRAIRVPTAIVLGDHDEEITREHTEYLAATIPGARLVILPMVGHPAMLQDPQGYTAAVLAFIDGK